jgi:D-alanine-D-alanine ligase
MKEKIHLGVLFGGRSGEHEVSLMSAKSILAVLDLEKYEIVQIGINHDGTWWSGKNVLACFEKGTTNDLYRIVLLPEPGNTILYRRELKDKIEELTAITTLDVIFPVLHGSFGEDGTLQGFLELADIAYVGAGVLGSSVGMDKGLFKDVMRANSIPVVDWIICNRKDIASDVNSIIHAAEKMASYPMFVKPANLGSSVGISKCKNRSDLMEGILDAARYDRRVLIEKGLNAREIEISVLGNEKSLVSVPGEIRPSDEFYSYKAKYIDGKSELMIPAQLNPDLTRQIQETALKVYRSIDCAGMARVDFLLEKDTNRLFVNEVNTIPGFTNISMYPKLWEASGLSYPKLINQLIELALERKQERNKSERVFSRSS